MCWSIILRSDFTTEVSGKNLELPTSTRCETNYGKPEVFLVEIRRKWVQAAMFQKGKYILKRKQIIAIKNMV